MFLYGVHIQANISGIDYWVDCKSKNLRIEYVERDTRQKYAYFSFLTSHFVVTSGAVWYIAYI